jgi:galactitol-specific phosphotransferase system IIB component
MRKLLLGIVAVVSVALLYYFTAGYKKITEEIRQEVNSEILALNEHGFNIKKDDIDITKEHFEIDFNDTKKIETFLRENGIDDIDRQVLEMLKGAILGVDISYNPSPTKAVAIDIYPIKLPTDLDVFAKSGENEFLSEIDDMLQKREILAHLEINKLVSAFDGYIKDIKKDEFKLSGFKFKGDLDDFNIEKISSSVDYLEAKFIDNVFKVYNYKSNIKNPLDRFNSKTIYSVEILSVIDNLDEITCKNLYGSSNSNLNNDKLVNIVSKLSCMELIIQGKLNENIKLRNIDMNIEVKNLSSEIFNKLNSFGESNESEGIEDILYIIKKLAKDNFRVDIPKVAISNVVIDKREMEGINLDASLYLDKNKTNLFQIDDSKDLLNTLIVNLNIEASNELVSFLSTNPNIMVLMMILTPVDKNGKKAYSIELINGEFKVNGNSIF